MADIKEVLNKLEVMDKRLDNIDVTLAKQEVSLDLHIKRTNLLEEKLEPVEQHVHMVNGALKFIGVMSLIIGIIVGIKELFKG